MNAFSIPPLITSLLLLIMGIFVFFKKEGESPINNLVVLQAVSFLWLFSEAMLYSSASPDTARYWAKTAYVGVILIPPTFYHFILSFLKTTSKKRYLLISYSFAAGFLVMLFSTDTVIQGARLHFWGYYPQVGPLHVVFIGYCAVVLSVTFRTLVIRLKDKTRPAQERNKIQLMMVSFIFGFLSVLDFLPKYGIEFYPVSFICISAWLALVSYSIVKHRLFDIQVAINKGTTHALTFSLGILPVAIIIYFLQKVFPSAIPVTLVLVIAVVLSFIFHKIYPHTERFVQKRLFKKRLNYYQVLRKFSHDMVTALNLQHLLQRLDETLHEALQVSSIAVYLTGPLNGKYPLIHISNNRDFVPGRMQKSSAKLSEQDAERENVDMQSAHLSALIPHWTSGDALVEMAFKTKDVLVLGEMEMMAREKKDETLDQAITQMREVKAEVCIPLKRDSTMIGIALLGSRENNGYYAPGDLDLLHSVGQNACVAIQNALLVEDMKRSFQLLHRTQRFAALGELVAGMSHEIRNPLMPITYLLELAGNPNVERERLKRQTEASWQALRRITGVLSEIETLAAPYKPEFKPAEIERLLDDAVMVLEPQIKEKKQAVVREYAALPEPMVDSDRLSQVFLDVLLNAVEANAEGGSIWVRTREIVLQGDLMGIQVEIEDSGCGIAPENIERVFDPFFTTKYKSIVRGGTGLGLSVAQRIMEDHRGTIELVSTVGKGTRVIINLPMREWRD
jgi:signal transduction histidine kinase